MTHPNENLVREGYAAFARGDLDALQNQIFAQDIRYHVPGRNALSGTFEGVAQVMEWLGRAFELSGGTLRLEVHNVAGNDERTFSLFTARAERAGKQLEDRAVHVFRIRDGKITEILLYHSDLYALDEFWS